MPYRHDRFTNRQYVMKYKMFRIECTTPGIVDRLYGSVHWGIGNVMYGWRDLSFRSTFMDCYKNYRYHRTHNQQCRYAKKWYPLREYTHAKH